MKNLFLIRHAKATRETAGERDHERPLSARGEQQLAPLAQALARCGAFAGSIFASNATRTRQTLEGILPDDVPQQRIHISRELYTFDPGRLLHWLQNCSDPHDTLALVGHNPALTGLAETLTGHTGIHLPTAGFIVIRLPLQYWQDLAPGRGEVERLLTPRDYSYACFARKQKGHAAIIPGDVPGTLTQLLRRMRSLEAGVRTGLDDEFLHQYRVAIRRSRALAEAVLDIAPEPQLQQRVHQLRQYARVTGRLRDLHVFLQQLPGLHALSPQLEPTLRDWLRAEAASEHQRLVSQFDDSHYREHMDAWDAWIHSRYFRKLAQQLDARRIRQAVRHRIRNFNRRTAEVLHTSPDEDIHRLRKQLKRIRYLMELDAGHWQSALRDLRQRQQIYGGFQDRCVQIALLDDFATGAPESLRPAIRRLRRSLNGDKARLRRQILSRNGFL